MAAPSILATLKKDGLGTWKSLPDFLEALHGRETTAVAALAQALGAEPAEQRELASADPKLLTELAGDLRLQKGQRLAAVRCLLEAGVEEQRQSQLFLAAGDLLTDPRLGSKARVLAEQGLQAALRLAKGAAEVSFEAGDLARAAHAASSVLGAGRVRELLAPAPAGHAGAAATLFALGEPLPEAARKLWEKLLTDRCAANRKAPAAARRMGLAPPWPPFLPEAFAPLVQAAEAATQGVATTDALVRKPAPVAAPKAGAPPAKAPAAAPTLPGQGPAAEESDSGAGAQQRRSSSQLVGVRSLAPPIRRMPRPTGTVMEGPGGGQGPIEQPERRMPAITPRVVQGPAQVPAGGLAGAVLDPLANVDVLAQHPMAARLSREKLAALALEQGVRLPDGSSYFGTEPLRFDPRGRRIGRSDRWRDDAFEWDEPVLPPSQLRAPAVARAVQGPFAARLLSLFEGRPEAVDRLCAAAEARAALVGDAELLAELTRELVRERWKGRRCPADQLERLRQLAASHERPPASRSAAQSLLTALDRPERAG